MKLKNEKGSSLVGTTIFFIVGVVSVVAATSLLSGDVPEKSRIPFIVWAVMGGVFAIIALIGYVTFLKQKLDKERLLSGGILYKGTIISTEEHPTAHINHVRPQAAICQYSDNITGGLKTVKSEYFYNNLTLCVGREVDIYIDRSNFEKYYVDMSKLVNSYTDNESQTKVHDFRN
ncbi:MAG: hypothetical protein E7490_00470 [Ruminococcaceae bacterium]|nr:hypothetical protein [Oscillospiraceae bacterium]